MGTQEHNEKNAKASSAAAFDAKAQPSAAGRIAAAAAIPKATHGCNGESKSANKRIKPTHKPRAEL